MPFSLLCIDTKQRVSGQMSLVYKPEESIHENQYARPPKIGNKVRVGSFYSTTYRFDDNFETGLVTQIISDVYGNRDWRVIKFKDDKGYTYIWEEF